MQLLSFNGMVEIAELHCQISSEVRNLKSIRLHASFNAKAGVIPPFRRTEKNLTSMEFSFPYFNVANNNIAAYHFH